MNHYTMNHDWEAGTREFIKQFVSCSQKDPDCEGCRYDLDAVITHIRTLLASEEARLAGELIAIEKEKWNDAEHCSCLGYAIVTVFGQQYEAALTPPPAQQYSTRIVDEVPAVDWSEPTNEDIDKAVSLLPQSKGECCERCKHLNHDYSEHCSLRICPCHKEAAKPKSKGECWCGHAFGPCHLSPEEAAERGRKGESTTN